MIEPQFDTVEMWIDSTPLPVQCDICEREWAIPLSPWDRAGLGNSYGSVVEKRVEQARTVPYLSRCPVCLLRFANTPAQEVAR